MTIPDYQTIMLPLLRFLGDGEVHSKREAVDYLAEEFKLTDEERKELLPSGKQPLFSNRVGWARTYLKNAGLIKAVRHGFFVVTDRRKSVLSEKPDRIDVKFLEQFPEFLEFRSGKKTKSKEEVPLSVRT
jgi:restriction system protein